MMQQTGDICSSLASTSIPKSISRTHYLLKELRDVGPAGQKVDFLYDPTRICVSSVKLSPP